MGVVVAITAGLVAWLVLWALGVNAIDAIMIPIVIALVGATVRILAPHLPGNRQP
jgi:hypothetical protein